MIDYFVTLRRLGRLPSLPIAPWPFLMVNSQAENRKASFGITLVVIKRRERTLFESPIVSRVSRRDERPPTINREACLPWRGITERFQRRKREASFHRGRRTRDERGEREPRETADNKAGVHEEWFTGSRWNNFPANTVATLKRHCMVSATRRADTTSESHAETKGGKTGGGRKELTHLLKKITSAVGGSSCQRRSDSKCSFGRKKREKVERQVFAFVSPRSC